MVAVNLFLSALISIAAAAPSFGPQERETELIEHEVTDLVKRQQRFSNQYWANDNAKLTWNSGAKGLYSVDWSNPSGGNFVVGKGYFGQGM